MDRSLLGAYGHDDRVCAYAEIEPLLTMGTPKHTAVCILADKEEIGSVGVTGMQSHAFEYFMEMLCDTQGVKLSQCFANSFCLSADVSNAFDPNFPEVSDRRNNCKLNYGVAILKYTGSRGKAGASDASAEAMGHVRTTLDKAGVQWQIATLGKVDQGGGGTVAAYMANRNIVTVDAGVPGLLYDYACLQGDLFGLKVYKKDTSRGRVLSYLVFTFYWENAIIFSYVFKEVRR